MHLIRTETREIVVGSIEVEPIRSVYELSLLILNGHEEFWRVSDYLRFKSVSVDKFSATGTPRYNTISAFTFCAMPVKEKDRSNSLTVGDCNVFRKDRITTPNYHFLFKTYAEARTYATHIEAGGEKLTPTKSEDFKVNCPFPTELEAHAYDIHCNEEGASKNCQESIRFQAI